MNAETAVVIFEQMKVVFGGDATVNLVVNISQNETVATDGLRSGTTIMRQVVRTSGLADDVDMTVLVKRADFENVAILRGKTAQVTYKGSSRTMRIVGTIEDSVGALVELLFGEYDRVVK